MLTSDNQAVVSKDELMKNVANFAIEYYQYLDNQGNVINPLPEFAKNQDILLTLYRWMVLTRTYDTKAIALQRTGQLGTFPSSQGQEAISVGMGYAMQPTDIFCPYYRDQGAMFIRGVKMSELFAYWGGDERGSDFKSCRKDFPIAVPVASQYLHATGAAFALKYRKEPGAVVTTVGDGGTSKGDFYEALNLAGAWQLPTIFVINNNKWAISVPLTKQTHCETLAQKAVAAGFEGVQVDGNDVIAVHDVVLRALERAKKGDGPTLIEAITYRLCDHTTADDAKRYCNSDEVKNAWQYDPLIRMRQYLIAANLWSEAKEEELQKQCIAEVEQAVTEYLNMPSQPPTAILDYMYEKWPSNLEYQRDELGEIKNA